MPINIVDEGATPSCIDSTFDSTKAIQRAINRAQVTHGSKEIEIPEGEFNVFGKLKDYNNLTFVGGSTPKHYWLGPSGDAFAKGGSVLKGNGTQELFDAPGESWTVSVKNLSFTGFTRLVVPNDPRSFEFEECSFKNMTVLNAPSSSSDMYQNFRFRKCAFTVYGLQLAVFSGRLIDCKWNDNIFLGSAGLDLNGARADRIFNNRFEWIDRAFAISMYGCDNIQFGGNWFDRIAGVGVQLKQGNCDISINGNIFSRCGGLLKADGVTPLEGVDESYSASLQMWGDQKDGLQINNNQFIKGAISDRAGASVAPKYAIAFKAVGGYRAFQFKGNSFDRGYAGRLIYDGGVSWMADNTKIETDAAFDYLDDGIVDLSTFSRGKIVAQNIEAVTVREIPEKLIVNNSFDASIVIAAGGEQTGVVFGGKVNGIRRFGKNEQLSESLVKQTVDGSVIGNKASYTVNNITKALRGAPIYLVANYSTLGFPEMVVEVADTTGATIATLTPLALSDGVNKMYTVKFIVPEDYALTSIKVYFYASKSVVKTLVDKITIDGFCATYGDWITRGIIDVNNV